MGRGGGGGAVMAVNNSELEAIVFLSHNPSVAHPKPTGRGGGGGGKRLLSNARLASLYRTTYLGAPAVQPLICSKK